jgi:hypothetical protein
VIAILGQKGEDIVELDEERKAGVVSNSMAVLSNDRGVLLPIVDPDRVHAG